MPRIREALLLAHHFKFLSHEEFVLLFDLSKPKNPEILCGERRIDVDDLCDDKCQTNLRFFKNDIYRLTEVLDLSDEIECYNGLVVDKVKHLRCSQSGFLIHAVMVIWFLCFRGLFLKSV